MKIETFLHKLFAHAKPAVLVYGVRDDTVRIERAVYDAQHVPVGFQQFGLHEVTGLVSIQDAVGKNPQGVTIAHFRSNARVPVYSHILTLEGPPPKVQGHLDRVSKDSLYGATPHVVRFAGTNLGTNGQSLDTLTVPPHTIYKMVDIGQDGTVHYQQTPFVAYDLSLVVGER